MLQLILLILKIIGFIILTLLGILLLLLIVVLFIPIRYMILVEQDERFILTSKISWLLHIVHARITHDEGKLHIQVRIFGRIIFDNLRPKSPKKKRRKHNIRERNKKIKRKDNHLPEGRSEIIKQSLNEKSYQSDSQDDNSQKKDRTNDSKDDVKEAINENIKENKENLREITKEDINQDINQDIRQDINQDIKQATKLDIKQDIKQDIKLDIRQDIKQDTREDTNEDTNEHTNEDIEEHRNEDFKENIIPENSSIIQKFLNKIRNFKNNIKNFFQKIKKKIKSIFDTLSNIKRIIGLARDFLNEEVNQNGIKLSLASVGKLLKHMAPTKLRVSLVFGTGDPCSTGQALGVASIIYGYYGECIQITPDFINKRFEGKLYARGRIRLFTLLIIVIKLILDKRFKLLKKNIKIFKEAL